MINIFLNGESSSLNKPETLDLALMEWGYQDGCYAIAINETFVPRSQYHQQLINEGDRIDVVSPLEGG
jgi:sulfur carrier protein